MDPSLPKLFCKELTPKEGYFAPNYFGPRDWVDRCAKLQDTAIMVREPAVQVMECIKASDLTKSTNRYVLYENISIYLRSCTLLHALFKY